MVDLRIGRCYPANLAEVTAVARAAGDRAERMLVVSATSAPAVVIAGLRAFDPVTPGTTVVTKADGAPWEPIASQIARHGVRPYAVAKSRTVADSLVLVGMDGLARRLLAA